MIDRSWECQDRPLLPVLAGWLLCCLVLPGPALVAGTTAGLREPVRLTAGAADQLQGRLAPNGRDLYYTSNTLATWQIFVQDVDRGAPRVLFDHDADATDPRSSPDGQRMLFVSYQTDATGDVCLMTLATGAWRCFTDERTSESQAFWFPDGAHVGVVSREGMHGDFKLYRYALDGGAPEVLVDRNLTSATVSPDGNWLMYVPVERGTDRVGVNFAMRAASTLEARRTHGFGDPVTLALGLPGSSNFPAFSTDGRYLYFSQYLNDTNLDGVIDGDDNSVLFRVPFEPTRPGLVDPNTLEQLTSAGWNCQYPSPAPDRLLATCAHQGSLDIYWLPLEGSIPPEWDLEKLEQELESCRDPWQKLLILNHMLGLQPSALTRSGILREKIRLHLGLREYASAEFYARQIQDSVSESDPLWRKTQVLLELIGARREEYRLSQGRLSVRFVRDQKARIDRLSALIDQADASSAALARVVISEIYDMIGEKGKALSALEGVDLLALADSFVIDAFGAQAIGLYRQLSKNDELLHVYQQLAGHSRLPARERLGYAFGFVRALVTGASHADRVSRLDEWSTRAEPGSELALALEVEAQLVHLTRDNQEEVRKALFDIYRQNKDFGRRRAIVQSIVIRAASGDFDYVLYEFANSWVSWLERQQAERRYAEELYREVLLERAYVSMADRDYGDARGYAFGLTRQTDSPEAHILFIRAWELEGRGDIEAHYAKVFAKHPDDPIYLFVQAYLIARDLVGIEDGEAFDLAATRALELAREASESMPRSLEVHHLWGFLAHQRFLRTRDTAYAMEANNHYLLALDLARDNVRFEATLLQALGILQAGVDSHRLALSYFERRARLPFVDPTQALCLKLAMARSRLHAGQDLEAAKDAAEAVVWVDSHPELERFRPLAESRAALYHYVAGSLELAWEYYQSLGPVIDAEASTPEARRTRLKLTLGRGATAQRLGRHDEALRDFASIQAWLDGDEILWPDDSRKGRKRKKEEVSREDRERSYGDEAMVGRDEQQLLVHGLMANSYAEKGDWVRATEQMQARKAALELRFEDSEVDEDLLEIAVTCHHLASYAYRAGDLGQAVAFAEEGLLQAGRYNERTGSPVSQVSLQLLRDYAELHLYGNLPVDQLQFNLKKRLWASYRTICESRSPSWASYRFLFALYLTLLELE